MNDERLIKALKEKNEEAFIKVVNQYRIKIVSLCYSYTADQYEAEDLSQEVFISLYNSIVSFRGESSLSTYIYRIAISKCIDYKRKRNIKSFLTGLFQIQNGYEENKDDANYIRQVISSLPEELKTPIILFYYTGLSQKEIADVLKTTPRAVEGRIYRAKQKIRLELEKEGYIDEAELGRYR